MRKYLWIPLLLLMFILVGCKDNNVVTEDKKVTINYYYGDKLLESKEYINEIELLEIALFDLGDATGEFCGWYLDKECTIRIDKSNLKQYFEFESINLYTKAEPIMKDLLIDIIGKIDDEYVLNPFFSWDGDDDTSYTVSLIVNGEVVKSKEVNTNCCQFEELLDANTTYVIFVESKNGAKSEVKAFKTLSAYDNDITNFSLANPFSDNMVLQRGVENTISGKGPSRQLLTLNINGQNHYTISDENGAFAFTLPSMDACFTPFAISLTNGIIEKKIENVLIGDVYLFAGQSNMQWMLKDSDYRTEDIDNLVNANVRFFCQDVVQSPTKLDYVTNGRWFVPDRYNLDFFSAIASMTGSMLGVMLKNDAPIGIITAYQGDTNIANWMGPEYYTGSCNTKYLHYNAMVYPLKAANLKGVVWYQGCNNSAAGCEYKDLLLDLFANYRDLFGNDELAFFVIGLACYDGDSGNNFDFSYVRESQALACDQDDAAYFISTCDNGDPTYIHPRAKRYICERVAKSIAAVFYGKDYYSEGPSYKSHTVKGNKVYIELNNASGLKCTGKITGLYLAGSDGKYYEAKAGVADGILVAYCDKVAEPVYIKYGFGKSPFVNIYNKDNFAITPFRTDTYNTNIDLLDYDKTDNYYFHPDGSKMEIAINDNNLAITKANDGKTYGSVRLDKWGAIIYQPQGFKFTVKGTNSGAAISFRMIEGDSYEIWGYKIVDDFEGERTFEIAVGDFTVMYNKSNNIFEPQKIGYIEVMVEASGAASFEVVEARFIEVARSKPMNFMISGVSELDDSIAIASGEALFANSYALVITSDNAASPIYTSENESGSFSVDKSLFEIGKPYYISIKAKNEIGETDATNSGYVFYLKDENKVTVCNFDFKNQDAFQGYMSSSMKVHEGLTCTLENGGAKIVSGGKGWQYFIFVLDTGAGNGMSKLNFSADFSNYNGSVVVQLSNPSNTPYSYTLDLTSKKQGEYEIEFSQFKNGSSSFTGQTLYWVMFNFSDSVGNGYILLDDVSLSK
ncbi:MAG: hypothetical protein J6X93_03780 [Bacilli bacterium]|nr:hypothetical protein [Bacilli bacterium]